MSQKNSALHKFVAELRLLGIELKYQRYYKFRSDEKGDIQYLSLMQSLKDLRTLPSSLFGLIHLKYLNLTQNKLTSLDAEFENFTNLQELIASENNIKTVSKKILQLSKLEKLDLRKNQLDDTLQPKNSTLHSLKKLNLSHNNLTKIPDFVFQLKNLEELNISFNRIKQLDERLFQFSKLEKLSLHGNKIVEFPQIDEMKSPIYYLDLSNNLIEETPILTKFVDLKYLNIRNNKIKEIKNLIPKNSNLTVLLAGNNKIKTIDNELIDLKALQSLDIRYNDIKTLPKSMINSKIEVLFFDENKIQKITTSLKEWLEKVDNNSMYDNWVIVM